MLCVHHLILSVIRKAQIFESFLQPEFWFDHRKNMSPLPPPTSTVRIQTVSAAPVVSGNLLVQSVCLLIGKTKIANIVFLNIPVIARGKVRLVASSRLVELQHTLLLSIP